MSWPTALFTLRERMSFTISLTVGGSRKKDEAVRFFKKILKGSLDCNEMLWANFLPIVQKKLLNSSHLPVTLQLPHISLIWELVVGTLDVFPDAKSNFCRTFHVFFASPWWFCNLDLK